MAVLRAKPKWQELDSIGAPLSGGKLYFYEVGTTTLKDTYTTAAATTANTNPVVLDSRGEADIWLDGDYKVRLDTSVDVTVWTVDSWVGASTSTGDSSGNVVLNGSFETDTDANGVPDSWVAAVAAGGTVARDTSDRDHGAACMKFVSASSSGAGTLTSAAFFAVTPTRTYAWSVLMKSSSATASTKLSIAFYTNAQVLISTTDIYDLATGNPTAWALKSGVVTPPATAAYGKFVLDPAESTGSDATVRLDDLRLEPGLTYLSLSDTPSTRSGKALEFLRCNAGETADEYAAVVATASSHLQGAKEPSKFTYSTTTAILMDAGFYHVSNGTKNTICQITSQLTYTFGSAGSNAGSTNLGASELHYLYIDYSALTATDGGTEVLVASDLINSTTAPTFNQAKNGLYNGNDRCIGARHTNSSSQLHPFIDEGDGWSSFQLALGAPADTFLSAGAATSITPLSPDVPVSVSTIRFSSFDSGSAAYWYIDLYVDGGTTKYNSDNHTVPAGGAKIGMVFTQPLDANQQFHYKTTSTNSWTMYLQAFKMEI